MSDFDIKSVRRKRLLSRLNVTAGLVLALVLAVMINMIARNHAMRADWSRAKYYSLSSKSENLLLSLTNRLDVVVFLQQDHELYDDVNNLLASYRYASDQVHVEWVDPNRDLARTEELAKKYSVQDANVVVFDFSGRSKFVTKDQIADFDYSKVKRKEDKAELVAFRGEEAFTSAIQSVMQERQPKVYFMLGHGERSPADFDPRKGYSEIGKLVKRDNVELKPLQFGRSTRVPEDCDTLVIAGPTKRFAEEEVGLIRTYLNRGGRILVLLDALTDTGLEDLFAEWGVELRQDIVIDPERTLKGRGILLAAYSPHPITEAMRGFSSIFYLPRSVRPTLVARKLWVKSHDKPKVIPLFLASKQSWSESQPEQVPAAYDADTPDYREPNGISMGVAVEKGAVGLDVQIKPTRLVVIGDSDFASNAGLTGGDEDVFMGSLNWLLERDELIGIAPKPVQKVKLFMTRAQLNMLFWLALMAVPGLFSIAGLVVWLRRRT
jgi:ABC-type uncharacterized transport system involved in gliding motility auxiliary subunit